MQPILATKIMTQREKLIKIMETEGLSARQFAEEVGIQAGTISNIVNGRNNPSMDVIQRVLNRFRTISCDWLVLDVGPMYRPNGAAVEQALFDVKPLEVTPLQGRFADGSLPLATERVAVPESEAYARPVSEGKGGKIVEVHKEITRILIFYTDGTFEER